MKEMIIFVLLTCMLVLAGCDKGTAQEPARNKGGTQAIAPANNTDAATDDVNSDTDSSAHKDVSIDNKNSDLIEIKEKLFIAQTNDIYLNAEEYLGKTIKYEGLLALDTWGENDQTYYYVIRYGPGCCGTDGNAGFEIVWDGEYPKPNDWVEVVGVLEAYEEEGWQYLRIKVSSLKILPTRGKEYVS